MGTMIEQLDDMPEEVRSRVEKLLRPLADGMPWLRPIRPRHGVVALGAAQRRFAVHEHASDVFETGQPLLVSRVQGPVDQAALSAALRRLTERHSALRTCLVAGLQPGQRTLPAVQPDLTVQQVAGQDPETRFEHAMQKVAELAERPFDMSVAPLWRAALYVLGEEDHLLAVVAHESICDASSARIFARDLSAFYRARHSAASDDLLVLPFGYPDYAAWQRERLTRARHKALAAKQTSYLAGAETPDLPTDHARQAGADSEATAMDQSLPDDLAHAVNELATRLAVQPHVVYLAAFAVLLRGYCRQEHLVLGVEINIRNGSELSDLIGCLTQLVPVRIAVESRASFAEIVRGVGLSLQEAAETAELGLDELAATAGISELPVVFGFPGPCASVALDGTVAAAVVPPTRTARADLRLRVTHHDGSALVDVAYRTGLFDDATMDRLLGHYTRLTAAAVAQPDRPVCGAEMMAPGERADLLQLWNGRYRSVPPATIHEWFADQASRTPNAIAVWANGAEITYRDLNRRANQLAHLLGERMTGPDTLVGVMLPRGIDLVVAILAILKAGGAFVPLDPGNPPARNAALLADFGAAILVTTAEWQSTLSEPPPVLLDLPALATELATRPAENPRTLTRVDDLAYALYTSGSTGAPKGVLIEHRAVVNFIESVRERFALTTEDRILGYASCAFDVSIFEIFGALLNGARLCLAEDADRLDLDRLQRLLETQQITVVDLPPAVLALLEPQRLERLRVLFIGGEAFSGELVNRWNLGRLFVNGYGPTECTVTTVVHDCPGHWQSSPPIGLPLPNHVAHVVDDELNLVPYGIPGELVIGGAGLARGYLNRPELTAQRFIDDPFGTAPGGRLYRTGDLVKRRRDGALVFLGRVDRQIKIRGVRIEPAEIEAALASHPEVRQVLVDRWTDPEGQHHLLAYLSLAAGAGTRPEELRRYLGGILPAAMVPKYVLLVPELPLNSSGKVDRSALPPVLSTAAPAPSAKPVPAQESATVQSPKTDTEKVLAEDLFGPVLGKAAVDVTAGFFDLGGGSLQAAQVVSGIRRRFEVEIGVADFFRDSTVVGLAAFIDRQRALQLDDDRLMELLESMSEGEVERMLQIDMADGIT